MSSPLYTEFLVSSLDENEKLEIEDEKQKERIYTSPPVMTVTTTAESITVDSVDYEPKLIYICETYG